MAKNKDNLAFPVADSKGECLNGSEGLSKMEYITTEILNGVLYSLAQREGNQLIPSEENLDWAIDYSIKAANKLFIKLQEDGKQD